MHSRLRDKLGFFLQFLFHLLITEIILLPFGALSEKLSTYDSTNFGAKLRSGA